MVTAIRPSAYSYYCRKAVTERKDFLTLRSNSLACTPAQENTHKPLSRRDTQQDGAGTAGESEAEGTHEPGPDERILRPPPAGSRSRFSAQAPARSPDRPWGVKFSRGTQALIGNDRGRCSPFLEGAESIQEGRRRAPSGQRLSPSLNRETPELAHPQRARLVKPLISWGRFCSSPDG